MLTDRLLLVDLLMQEGFEAIAKLVRHALGRVGELLQLFVTGVERRCSLPVRLSGSSAQRLLANDDEMRVITVQRQLIAFPRGNFHLLSDRVQWREEGQGHSRVSLAP